MAQEFAAVIINRKAQAVDRVFHYRIPAGLLGQVEVGSVVQVPFRQQQLEGVVVELTDSPDVPAAKMKDITSVAGQRPLFSPELIALGEWVAKYYACPRTAAFQAMLPAGLTLTGRLPKSSVKRTYRLQPEVAISPRAAKQLQVAAYLQAHGTVDAAALASQFGAPLLRTMVKAGSLVLEETMVWGDASEPQTPCCRQLSPSQQQALAEIRQEAAAENRPVLLFGVTGSGKTELYIRRAQEVLAQGKQVLFLVPEIALTPQMVDMLQDRLGQQLAVLHSGLLGSKRRETWQGIAQGHYQVVVGARSAVFAPLKELGLILLDEEHEASYKQENVPRFHAREVAKQRSLLCGAQLILGSATPSLESFYAAQQGQYRLVTLAKRVGDRPLPQVEVVDMRQELRAGNRSMFSRCLYQAMAEHLAAGNQVVLFLNRRGYHTFVSCRQCGYVVQCPHCNLPMAYHQGQDRLKCHYCGAIADLPKVCPQCGSSAIRFFGAGTQKVAQEAARLFPQARIARMDRDSIEDRDGYERIYRQMKEGRVDLLIGTQMVAKGLDFPGVTLVGVVAADTVLNLPELTASERTFQLLTQVAGRAGRHQPGQVVIQSYQPEHEAIQAAAKQDYASFYQQEIQQRQLFGYPPFSKIIRIVASGEDEAATRQAATDIRGFLTLQDSDAAVLGPAPAPYSKVKDRYRFQVMLKGPDLEDLRQQLLCGLEQAQKQCRWAKDVRIQLDIEPMSMM